MNWIIRHSKKMPYHTHLDQLLAPIQYDITELKWLISDLEYGSHVNEIPVNMNEEYFVLSPDSFQKLIAEDVQIYWGAFLALPENAELDKLSDLPFVERNPLIWRNGNIQHSEAVIEIDCFDSGYTIVKFKDQTLSDKFKAYFDEAIDLETFTNRFE